MFAIKALQRQRRQALAECRLRESIYKERMFELLADGAAMDEPDFVEAFTSARNAHLDYKSQLASNMQVDATERKARTIKNRIEEQAARKLILDTYRRYQDPALAERLEREEDDIFEKEANLEEAAESCKPLNGRGEPSEWLDEEDEALLTKWMLARAQKPQRAGSAAPAAVSTGFPRAAMKTSSTSHRPSYDNSATAPQDSDGDDDEPATPAKDPPKCAGGYQTRQPPSIPRIGKSESPKATTDAKESPHDTCRRMRK
ncbi:tegument protein UL14 [Columbid alphaherpesvirus 1]|uniref:Tegument protein UL14 n=1 Tax=Columbid alphaherpesvirus 1 TaxID=93386 RepID=A0A1V0M8F2_9ALPH|nr:tegument protein UL14 [Columbid alphaherpesvirus 1]ARD71334.1 tegument protein UL14 [Columbid alphaherpesvirus 1]